MENSQLTEETTDAAIAWFVRLRATDVTDLERALFFSWLREAREHQQAFVEILKMWQGLSVVKQMDFEELRQFPQIWEFKRKAELSAVS